MKIKTLDIQNFLTIGSAVTLKLDDRGLCLIQGDNRDDSSAISNGAGKSTIGDAICWCLYGTTARGEEGDDVINNLAKKDCRVRIVLESGGETYIISRYRKDKTEKNTLQVYKSPGMADLTKGTDKLTQELVTQIIGCSYEVFVAAVYAAQEKMPNLPGMTDKFLKAIVEEAAGIDRLGLAYEKAKTRAKTEQSRLSDLNHYLSRLQSTKGVAESQIQECEQKAKEFEDKRKDSIETMSRQMSGLIMSRDALIVKIDSINESGIWDEIKALDETLKQESAEYDQAKDALAAAQREEARIASQLSGETNRLKKSIEAIKTVQSRVGQPCGECGKPYCEHDLVEATAIAKKKADGEKQTVLKLRDDLEAAKKTVSETNAALLSLDDTETRIKKNQAARAVLQRELNGLNELRNQRDKYEVEIKHVASSIERREKDHNSYEAMIRSVQIGLDKTVADITTAEQTIAEIEEECEIVNQAVAVFGPAGVRAHVLDTVTPYLNERTSHYLATLSDGNISAVWNTLSKTKSGELREKFTIEVDNEKGSKRFNGLSGGEKRKVRLSTAMALQDLVASRASKPIGLWIADEIDDALDEAGLERLMTVLEDKAKEKGTVLMISHNGLSDWCNHVTTVVKENGFSRVEGDLVA